ncbi:hypothetical protein G6F32_016717 [Rhizopus arrhizus]|nr:hypothetical protein G6F32_016717 [Rhizopus arrhizus]
MIDEDSPDDRGARPGRATAGGPGVRDADDQRRACATACGGRRSRAARHGLGNVLREGPASVQADSPGGSGGPERGQVAADRNARGRQPCRRDRLGRTARV